MKLNEYQELAGRTSGNKQSQIDKITNGLMGLNGEAGECIDVLKKHLFQGHALNKEKIIDELGDVMWYIAETATGLGTTLEAIATHNVNKLKARYPEGFEADKSIHRKE